MQTRIVRGRALIGADRAGAPLVAVVSDAMGRALWPGRDPIGQCMHVGLGEHPDVTAHRCTTVVGIAENSAQQDLTDDPRFMYYLAAEQFVPGELSTMLIRVTARDAASQAEAVRRALTREMPGDGFVVVSPLQDVVDDHMRSWRLGAILFLSFGGFALAVAFVGQRDQLSRRAANARVGSPCRTRRPSRRRRVVGGVAERQDRRRRRGDRSYTGVGCRTMGTAAPVPTVGDRPDDSCGGRGGNGGCGARPRARSPRRVRCARIRAPRSARTRGQAARKASDPSGTFPAFTSRRKNSVNPAR